MNIRFLVYGIFIALLWKTENGESVILTTTLLTGFMGGFLIGKMTLGTFLGVLSNTGNNNRSNNLNLPSLPTLPSVNLSSIRLPTLPSFPALLLSQLEQEELDLPASDVSGVVASATTSAPPVVTPSPTYAPVYYAQPTAPSMPYVYTYPYPVMYPYQTYYTTTTTPSPMMKLSMIPIKSADVPLSLDNKIRDRFIRQLAIMDPLHCLPKIFCEVTADPLGATYIMDHAAITSVGPIQQASITQEEVIAYENHLQRQRTTTTPAPPPTTTTTTAKPAADEDKDDSASEEDDEDVSAESASDEDDDSFEQYRKEQEHKIEMQALEEMVDEVEDPEMYMLILRDKQKKKAARKRYKEKQRQKNSSLPPPSSGATSFREELPFSEDIEAGGLPYEESPPLAPVYDIPDYNDGSESEYLNRRMSVHGPPPPPSMEPPRFYPPIFTRIRTTEAPISDMFADDPFFDDFPSSKGRNARVLKSQHKKRAKRQIFMKDDLMRKYRIAYLVAEKYRKPEMCEKTFPSCPYRAKTILSVVNRLESGLMPFQLQSDKKTYFNGQNNIMHFKNTLQAIERLNKMTLQYQERGEPIDIDKLTEVASNPTSTIDANTSQTIVEEFQKVVAKIKSAKLKKRKKHKRKKHVKNQTKYDAVHYYKKAQMENLRPKQRVKPGLFHAKESVRQQDDEHQMHGKLGEVPSFKQTYKEMFKVSKVKVQKGQQKSNNRRKTNNNTKTNQHSSNKNNSREKQKTSTVKPVTKFSDTTEDDEQDAKESEEAVNALIVQGKQQKIST